MNRIRILTISLLFLSVTSYGQRIVPEVSIGWGEYKMEELKEMQSSITTYYPVRLKSVNSFPPYYFHKVALRYAIHQFQFGISWNHYSTGARDHYEDYSGEISVKQLIHSNVFSFPFMININPDESLNFFLTLEPGFIFTRYVMIEEARIMSDKMRNKFADDTEYLSIEPGIRLAYSIGKWQPSINFGYFFDTKINMKADDDDIIFSKNESKYSDFSGIRFCISVSYQIELKKQDKP